MKTLIQAHRGASAYCPENTLEAFSLAIEMKADGIELDVHLSKDGQIVVAHDERLERVSDGSGYINEHTLAELKSLDFGKPAKEKKLLPSPLASPPRPENAVFRMPTMAEVFALIKPSALTINIELKTTEILYPELPEKLMAMVRDFGMEDRVIYSSFNHYSLQQLLQIDPKAKTGLLYNIGIVDPWVYANYTHAYAIHPHFFIIASLPEAVARCHENGVKVNVWTVDDSKAIKLMLECGVDGIISNRPDVAIASRDEFIKGGTSNAGK